MNIASLRKRMRFLARGEQGVAFIEFAFSVTLLVLMFFGAIEISRYILMVQKVEKTVDTLTDVFTQAATNCITTSQVTDYLNATSELMSPYTVGTTGIVYFTDVIADAGGSPKVNWQVNGGGTLSVASQIAPSSASGTPASLAPIPGYTMQPDEEAVIGEMYYIVTPIALQNVVAPTQIYRVAIFKPRFVSSINPPQASCP